MVVERWLVYILKWKRYSLFGVHTCTCTRVLAHVHLSGYMNETVELPLPHMN